MKPVFARLKSALAPLEYLSLGEWPRFLAWRRGHGSGETSFKVKSIARPLICRAGTTDAVTLELVFGLRSHLPPVPLTMPAPVIIDLGANVGFASADLAARYPKARIVSVELDPANAAMARRNLQGTACEVVNAAIWTSDGTISFGGDTEDAFAVGKGTNSAPSVTLTTLLDQRGLARADFVKMDVEGAEWDLLHMPGWLDRVDAIALEVHHREWMAPLTAILTENGFSARQCPFDHTRLEGFRPH